MAVFPVLSCPCSLPLDPDGDIEDIVLRSPQESGYEQTRPRATRARRNFGVNYSSLPNADVAALRTFEITTLRNGADSFSWTHPITATVYIVRLVSPIQFLRSVSSLAADVSIKLREV